ncbi:MAG: hypothetical protein Q7T03_05460 [Deltaproteobacteria bacterium]|nr:hypothetical protein [Deltaproteobacteria bacterium]
MKCRREFHDSASQVLMMGDLLMIPVEKNLFETSSIFQIIDVLKLDQKGL